MHEFRVSLRLGKMVLMVFRLNKVFAKSFEVWNHSLNVLGYEWRIGFGKLKREDDEMNKGYRRICTYFPTKGIHQEIRRHELATQENPPKRLRTIYILRHLRNPPRGKQQ